MNSRVLGPISKGQRWPLGLESRGGNLNEGRCRWRAVYGNECSGRHGSPSMRLSILPKHRWQGQMR